MTVAPCFAFQMANVMDALVKLCKGKSVPKDALGRKRARAAAVAALEKPGAVMSDDSFLRSRLMIRLIAVERMSVANATVPEQLFRRWG